MSIAAVSNSQVASLIAPRAANEEANESGAARAREAAQTSQPAKASPAPGTGTVLDVNA